jgi:hypothetical protein
VVVAAPGWAAAGAVVVDKEQDMTQRIHRSTLIAAAVLTACALGTPAVHAQRAYPSAEAASQAFHEALSRNDAAALRTVLGANWKSFVPEVAVSRADVDTFLAAWDKQHKVIVQGDKAELAVGEGNWTLPVPLARTASGWHFDPRAGADVMRTRRIGRNELNAMQAVYAYFDAQKEYAMRDRDGDGVLSYAMKIFSTPGRHDGLYWDDKTGTGQSPLGPQFGGHTAGQGYHGYYFRILQGQGKNAPGGAYDYVIGGRMRSGFALVAWPMQYGQTGVTSFMISHDGVLYEKDLGPDSDAMARAMSRFDPDASWRKVGSP